MNYIWQNQEVIIVRNLRANLQNEDMVEIQVSPNQNYQVPLRELQAI